MKVRKKPVVVEAYKWDGKFNDDVADFSWMVALESQSEKCPHCGELMIKPVSYTHLTLPTILLV